MLQKPCAAATNWSLWRARSHDFAKFPVKFPVSRENGQSMGPSALRRQPASPVSRDFSFNVVRKPAVGGLLASGKQSPSTKFDNPSAHCAEILRPSLALWPFPGESSWRLGSIALRDRRVIAPSRRADRRSFPKAATRLGSSGRKANGPYSAASGSAMTWT